MSADIYDMTMAEYLAHPALSRTGMKLLLQAPAKFKHEQERPEQKASYDFGSVWHKRVLGDDTVEFEVVQKQNVKKEWVDADSYDGTKSAAESIERIRSEGKVPILRKDLARVDAMLEAWNQSPAVREYMDLAHGSIEQTIIWTDARTGVELKVRIDFLPEPVDGRAFDIVDPKSAVSSEPHAWLRKAADYGYHLQDALCRRAVRELGIHPRPGFVFLVQEKTPPYIVTPVRLDPFSAAIGDHLIDRAIDIYRRCTATGQWGGYVDELYVGGLPKFYTDQFEGVV